MNNDAPPFFRGRVVDGLDHHGGAGGLGWIIFALQLLMLAGLAVLLVRAFAWRPAAPRLRRRRLTTQSDPLEHVRWRYARGEMTRDEYLQATHDLGGEPDAPTEGPPAS